MPKVLVIDDEQMIRELLMQALSLFEFKVDTAENAKGGMAKFDSQLYDLVITDVRTPGVDGHKVVHHVRRSKHQYTPVIGLSGTPWLLHNGDFDDVLHKPFTIRKLIEKAQLLTRPNTLSESA